MARPRIGICTAIERARWSYWDTEETPVTYTGDMAQIAVAVGDLDGDQRDDVVLADFGGPVSVYLTQVDGTLANPVTYGSFTAAVQRVMTPTPDERRHVR